MTTTQIAANPFALMMHPEMVFAAIEHSERLARLHSRICRPLDKPLIARPDDGTGDEMDNETDAMLAATFD